MVKLEYTAENKATLDVNKDLIKDKRHLTQEEIEILIKNQNKNEDNSWSNVFVDSKENCFDASLIVNSEFSGLIVLGVLKKAKLAYHDLVLEAGIYNSKLINVVTGNDNVIRNSYYIENYHLGDRVILFNIHELCCTKHSKFGNGILKKGESEENRVWIGVANENDGREILPFESMIPADAYLWSHYRDDEELLKRFVELTEYGNSGEYNTFGFIDDDVVIKNSNIIKDAKIGKCAYIKGAFKLKNITILSSEDETSQIGEGVEMVNGILGYGSKVFYQAIAIRFVIGRNCQVKYGARILNSVLGDNSTVSCCEILNNLIFPFHEQHHNSSFLIATTIMGQSNIASGATIGSNHNSRSPDGEIIAKRGFWPGLCSDFKHNSKFASFDLISKGSYQYELDIPYPFALVSIGVNGDQSVHITPAWWFMYDMFAITRNKYKFIKRDKRKVKIQSIEVDPLAPDTMEEIMMSLDRLIGLTLEYLLLSKNEAVLAKKTQEEKYQAAKDFLHQNPDADFTLNDSTCQKRYGAVILKPVKAYKMYRKIVKYFATKTLMEYCKSLKIDYLTLDVIEKIRKLPLYTQWENVGGQIIPSEKVKLLFSYIKNGSVNTWDAVHAFYTLCDYSYEQYKVRYALYLLEQLYSCSIEDFSCELYKNIIDDVTVVAMDICDSSYSSREKDYTDYYRNMTYHSKKEMDKVIGSLKDNSFLNELREDIKQFIDDIPIVFKGLIS